LAGEGVVVDWLAWATLIQVLHDQRIAAKVALIRSVHSGPSKEGNRFVRSRSRVVALATFVLCVFCVSPVYGALPGQNGKIALSIFEGSGLGWEIYTMQPDGSELTRLTTDSPGSGAFTPAWSPDGKKIAFIADEDIWVMNADGSSKINLTRTPASGGEDAPAWSPDGTRIAFSTGHIWVMNADGTNSVDLMSTIDGRGEHPAWSPDGSTIVFASFVDRTFGLHAIRPDGNGLVRLTSNGNPDAEPDWSPDGTRFVFASGTDDLGRPFNLHAMNADGTQRMQLTQTAGSENWPQWSPDGSRILFAGEEGLRTMAPDGSDIRAIPIEGSYPDWQPLPAPNLSDYKNASAYCTAVREFMGDSEFSNRYKNHGKCVSSNH
jgi:Tol biopolymer transport system component